MKRKVLFIFITVIIVLFLFFTFKTSSVAKVESIIDEEASPIREDDEIVGMNYSLIIGKDTTKDNIIMNTSILSSIIHYKDIDSIRDFFIDLKIINKSEYRYLLKNIYLTSNDSIIKKIDYSTNNNIISFYLNKEDLIDDSYIQIELER